MGAEVDRAIHHGAGLMMGFAANLRTSDGRMRKFLRRIGTTVETTAHPPIPQQVVCCWGGF